MGPQPEGLRSLSRKRARDVIWGSIQMAASGIVPAHNIFRFESSGPGEIYTLTPLTPSTVPLQCVHIGQGAIPDALADIPRGLLPIDDLLAKLNSVLGTSYTLDTPGVRDCLKYALGSSHDFGEVYGTLRSEWSCWQGPEDSAAALTRMKDRCDEVQRKRDNAIRGHSIQNSRIPPRRVWDLYSNRVLPFHVMPWAKYEDDGCLPDDLWTVSHSWVREQDRKKSVMTVINGRRWCVPIPRGTSLDHIRIELLNMGARYVWLDVLCLWQEGNVDDDEARLEEWKLDVPTIGYIYQDGPRERPCITYFNGLGLPFDPSPAVVESDRHWFNRVWTVQETRNTWLPGGLTATPHVDSPGFFSRLEDLLPSLERFDAIRVIRDRHCTTELDRIAGLAYFLECETLPLYDQSASSESAWTLLIKHMHPWWWPALFCQYESDVPFGLFVSWATFLGLTSLPALELFESDLELVDPLDVHTNEPGQYCHTPPATEPCYIVSPPDDTHQGTGPQALQLHFYDRADPITVQVSATRTHGCLVPHVPYRFLTCARRFSDIAAWVAVEVVGERDLRGKKALEVIKWGVILVDIREDERLRKLELGSEETTVVYLSGEEALARSGHVDKYMGAFNMARESRKAQNEP
ncbi:uncharacterized protein PHACADRAFT_266097 [Phanerochaete carnosa HHB-10118-sp]|uniref:Heterokaryon incompatibility domain-containing protein n=1 Tax=Phanerochaete carnosa (strain HHB-10118-sp) TaxID=650164 RepID=K5VQ09_PHACS|nr:uncharacterized protein PHACADRAFT_266097 [Phanerochaete carnosa HHB-10118-sp]EKM48790.1 hypothetical protein PHACADRAFT_266097 [Phanerochaete carnosa HHB-10118-sp]